MVKRLAMAGALLAVCVAVSAYASHFVGQVTREVDRSVEGALDALERQDYKELAAHIDRLSDYWSRTEGELIHLVRHGQIDAITEDVSRLRALAAGGDYAEMAAELHSIRWQMDHIYQSERMAWRNLL